MNEEYEEDEENKKKNNCKNKFATLINKKTKLTRNYIILSYFRI